MRKRDKNFYYKRFIFRGKASVFIDWANVHGWENSLKREVDIKKLFVYPQTYPEISDIRLYFGEDEHPKSKEFSDQARRVGYIVASKPIKYIPVAEADGKKILRRKCDFDMGVYIDTHTILAKKPDIQSFVFFTGDGDYEPLYKILIGLRK